MNNLITVLFTNLSFYEIGVIAITFLLFAASIVLMIIALFRAVFNRPNLNKRPIGSTLRKKW